MSRRSPIVVGLVAAGLAVVATALLHRWLPLADTDPLRLVWVLMPITVTGFALLESAARRRGSRSLSGRAAIGYGVALAGLFGVSLARPHLGLHDGAVRFVYAGLVLVLAHYLIHLLPRWRPILGTLRAGFPRRPSALFFLLPLWVYLALLPWSTTHRPPDGDEPYYLLVAHSLAYDLDADLANQYAAGDGRRFLDRPLEPQPGDPVGPGGEQYSRHNALLPLVLAPAYRLAGLAGALAMMAAMAAALAWVTLRLARHYLPDRPGDALAGYGLLAFASPVLLYSYQVWVEVPATLLAAVVLERILAMSRDARQPQDAVPAWGWREWVGIGLPMLLLPLVKIRFMAVAGPLLALAWWRTGRPLKPLIVLTLLLGAVGAGILWFNQQTYDNPLKIHSWQELDVQEYGLADYARGGVGMFWDPALGLFGPFPLWVLVVPAVLWLLRRRHRWLLDFGLVYLPYLLLVASRREWFGGWSPPFRYALIALPLLAVAVSLLWRHRHRGGARALVSALGLLTVALTVLWLTVPGWTYNIADGSTYLLDHLDRRFGADVTRLFPSGVRVRPATWVWPALTLLLAPLLWWRPRRLPSARAWGATALLAALAAVPWAARSLPTRMVEIEDDYVRRDGGVIYPRLWKSDRPKYRGGWVVRKGESITAPVVPGGSHATLHIDARHVRNAPGDLLIEVRVGDRRVGVLEPETWPDGWRRETLGPIPWPEGADLQLRGLWNQGPLNGVIFDRVLLDWSEGEPSP